MTVGGQVFRGGVLFTVFAGPNRPILHALFQILQPVNALGTFTMSTLTATELAWLNDPVLGINADRARYSAAPLVFDEYSVEAARYWAAYEGSHGWYGHVCPATDASCVSTLTFLKQKPGFIFGGGQNLDVGVTADWPYSEARIMAESANCPNGSPTGCVFAENTGHFLNLVNQNLQFIGLGVFNGGKAFNGSPQTMNYLVQDFG